jgi:hypothetical protein
MYNVNIVTYATHNFGNLNKLIHNDFNVKITVLGWGEKWNSFIQKFEAMYEHCKQLEDDDILIFMDGFDTSITKHPSVAIKRFLDMDCKVLLSEEKDAGYGFIGKYFSRKMFGSCKNNHTANSGLYMGYVRYLKLIYEEILCHNGRLSDDQLALNNVCDCFDFIKIDHKSYVFENGNCNVNRPSVFCQMNGGTDLSIKDWFIKFTRPGTLLYVQAVLPELCCLLFLFLIIYRQLPRKIMKSRFN